jgi:hypothetical protein
MPSSTLEENAMPAPIPDLLDRLDHALHYRRDKLPFWFKVFHENRESLVGAAIIAAVALAYLLYYLSGDPEL